LVEAFPAVGVDEALEVAVENDEVDEAVVDEAVVEEALGVTRGFWSGRTNASVAFSQPFSLALNMHRGSCALPPENTMRPLPSSATE
jgi:hypothetical protein